MARATVFGPTEIRELVGAFEAAWLELLLADGDELMDGPAVRSRLAEGIMEAAANGETDPQRLKEYALRGVLQPSRPITAAAAITYAPLRPTSRRTGVPRHGNRNASGADRH